MAVDLLALKAEFDTDPTGLVYTLTDPEVSHATLNLLRSAIQIAVASVTPEEIMKATVFSELVSADQQRKYIALTQAPVDPNAANIVGAFADIFAAGPTRTALQALQTRDGSRAEQLFAQPVSINDVHKAFGLP